MKIDALILDSHAPSAVVAPSATHIEATSDAATTTDAASSINMFGLALTLACAAMAVGLGYGCYAYTCRMWSALSITAMSFLPLRVMMWIAVRN
jgi:hypothetical protein